MSEHTQGGYEALKTSHECRDCGMKVFHEYAAPSPDEREALDGLANHLRENVTRLRGDAEFIRKTGVNFHSHGGTEEFDRLAQQYESWSVALARLRAVGRDAETLLHVIRNDGDEVEYVRFGDWNNTLIATAGQIRAALRAAGNER